jgi:hypothetical protein
MNEAHWLDLLTRITSNLPLDLDAEFFQKAVPRKEPEFVRPPTGLPLSVKLWERTPGEPTYIGIRVSRPLSDVARLAVKLASAAVERCICPVIITSLPASGFESYGFRVEKVPAVPNESRITYEAELLAFWGLALVIDAEDISVLG